MLTAAHTTSPIASLSSSGNRIALEAGGAITCAATASAATSRLIRSAERNGRYC